MRPLLIAAVALSLSGCAAPEDGEGTDPLFGVCPQWMQGPGEQQGNVALTGPGAQQTLVGNVTPRHLDRPLDLLRIQVTQADVDGDLELRAVAADGSRLNLRDYRLPDVQTGPVVHLAGDADGKEFDAFLSPVLQDGLAAPMPVQLNWTLDGGSAQVAYTVTFHYKVCGL